MKKVITITMVFISILFMTACSKETQEVKMQKIEYEDEIGKISFSYPRSLGFSAKEEEDDNGKFLAITNYDFSLNMYLRLQVISREMYDSFKERYKNAAIFKEYEYKGHEAYIYGYDTLNIQMILLEKESGYMVILYGILQGFNENSTINAFNQKGIQDFLSTVEFTKK